MGCNSSAAKKKPIKQVAPLKAVKDLKALKASKVSKKSTNMLEAAPLPVLPIVSKNASGLQPLEKSAIRERPKFCLNLKPVHLKNHMYNAIKGNDFDAVCLLIEHFGIEPQEELSTEGYYWTALHYAVYFDRPIMVGYFAKRIHKFHREDYIEIMNLKNRDNLTPMMLGTMYGKTSSVEMLFKCGGVRLYEKNNFDKIALDIAISYQKPAIEEILRKEMDKLTKPTNTPINKEFLEDFDDGIKKSTKDIDPEEQDEYQNLLLQGKPIGCIACSSNKGLLKYTSCCGQPYHPICAENKQHCPLCNVFNFQLTSEIKHPHLAYVLGA